MTEPQAAGKHGSQSSENIARRPLQALIALLLIVSVAIVVAVLFIVLRRSPERVEAVASAPLIEVRKLHVQNIPMVVQGYGTVTPSTQVDLVSEVAGRVVFVHSELEAGGIIPAGEMIVQIDPSEYDVAVRQAQAAVAQAQVQLDLFRAGGQIIQQGLQQSSPGTETDSPLAAREPQVRQAETALEAAKAQLAMAELRLKRTAISLPFDVLVIRERVALSQFVDVGQSFATAYGIDTFEVEVPLRAEDLAWFDVPKSLASSEDAAGNEEHVQAEVRTTFAGRTHVWSGQVTRTTGQVDPATKKIPVVVEVSEPLESADSRPPLLPGTFVDVRILGRTLEDAVAVPASAIEGESRVWLVDNGRLRSRSLKIVRRDDDFAYVTSGLPDGAWIVVDPPQSVVEGMAVRVQPVESQ